jgi:hypothetical protein
VTLQHDEIDVAYDPAQLARVWSGVERPIESLRGERAMLESRRTGSPLAAALTGGLLMLPFAAANAIVGRRIEPFFSFIRSGPHSGAFEYLLLFVLLGCLPVGAAIAARPLFERGAGGKRRFYLLNALVAALMLAAFAALAVGLGAEIYRCDVLMIPNCD